MARIPAAMLSLSGPLPRGRGWSYEVKWDGFRAIVSTFDGLRVQSRRRWNMTELVPELASLPEGLILDGELVAWGDDGLHRRSGIAVTYVVFDVLEVVGLSTMLQPYHERRAILQALELDKPAVLGDVYDDGEALFQVVCDRGIEGVIAKKLSGRYVPGDRGSWVKVKNPNYWRLHAEREHALRRRPSHQVTDGARRGQRSEPLGRSRA